MLPPSLPIEASPADTYLDFNTHARALVSPNRTHQSHFLEKITTNAPEERGMAADTLSTIFVSHLVTS